MMGFHSRELEERWALDKLKQTTDPPGVPANSYPSLKESIFKISYLSLILSKPVFRLFW